MKFEEIKKKAQTQWEGLKSRIYILIGAATCGRAAGALEVIQAFEEELKRRNLEIPLIQVGCIGLCYAEPLVVISKPQSLSVVYQNIHPDSVSRLIGGYIEGDDPCLELALGTL